MTLNVLDLFAGAGGGILGGRLLGWRTVCAIEVDTYCQQILLQRQRDGILPRFPIWDDVCTFNGKPWRGHVDIVTGGFPCQAFSKAAHGHNTAINYWPEMLRIIGEVQPKYVFAENVCEDAIVQAQGDLEECGYETVRTQLSGKDVGADHIRKRWWLLAYTNDKGELGSQVNAEMAKLKKGSKDLWQTDPRDTRMVDGLANRVDRFRAVGNGQIPLVAAIAWCKLIEASNA